MISTKLNYHSRSTADNRLCCLIRSNSTNCTRTSTSNPLDTCGSLYPTSALEILSWLIALVAVGGNVTAFYLRSIYSKRLRALRVQDRFILNLSLADCLMGVYMIIITSAHIYYGDQYYLNAPQWRGSALCSFAGFLAILSSEVSVFTLTLITLDRLISIRFLSKPEYQFRPKTANTLISVVWVANIALGLVLILFSRFKPAVYGFSDVCIGLPLHVESDNTGYLEVSGSDFTGDYRVTYHEIKSNVIHPPWWFSIVIFIGINGIAFLVILISYIMIFYYVKQSARRIRSTMSRKRETKAAIRMAVIVGTDFFCWMPIVIMGILTQTGSIAPSVPMCMLGLPLSYSLSTQLSILSCTPSSYTTMISRRS